MLPRRCTQTVRLKADTTYERKGHLKAAPTYEERAA